MCNRVLLSSLFVTGLTLAVLCSGCLLVIHSLQREASGRRIVDAMHDELGAANNILGFAVRIGGAPGSVWLQQAAAERQAVAAWQSAHAAAGALESRMSFSSADARAFARLNQRQAFAYEDMLAAVQSLVAAVPAAQAGDNSGLQASVSRLASREAAYADALVAQVAMLDGVSLRAAVLARTESWLCALVALFILGAGCISLVLPATRESRRLREQRIRAHEQSARIGSEVARHVAERERVEAEAQFQALFRHSSIGVALVSEDGIVMDVNAALERMLGYAAPELRGTKFAGWRLTETQAAPQASEDGECLYRRKDGSALWVEVTSTKAYSADGRILAVIRMIQDVELRKAAQERLHHEATHDSLTGLHNRRYLDQEIARMVEAVRSGSMRPFSVLLIDLDRFKHVNDTRGHATGDALLSEVGGRLASWAGRAYVVARYGGDEFVALLPEVWDAAGAGEAAKRLQQIFNEPVSLNGLRLRISASVGICLWDPVFGDADAVLRAADNAAYYAKALGRSRAVLYDSTMLARDELRRRVITDLRAAVLNRQLSLVYQPIVALPERRCIGFEALARWAHPELGEIGPSLFIPVAEEVGLIEEIGAWTLRTACAVLSGWRERQPHVAGAIRLNVNLSPQQMVDAKLPALLQTLCAQAGLATDSLALELTETAMFDGLSAKSDTLAELRRLGSPIVLDDFGTGYSSLSHLLRLSMDALKIDQSFVSGSDGALAAPAIVEALIAVAKSLHIGVVAEGVETWRQAAALSAMGCHAAQGFLFSAGLDADAALQFLCNNAPGGVAAAG